MVHSPLIRPAISWGGGIGGSPLGSHEKKRLYALFEVDTSRQQLQIEPQVRVTLGDHPVELDSFLDSTGFFFPENMKSSNDI